MINFNIRFVLITLLSLTAITLFTGCPKPPDDEPPKTADCDPGYLPCEEDSTICCEVICPLGFVLGGADSTECIPVQCPEYYHLCGEDSTDCCLDTSSHNITWEVDTVFTGLVNWAYDVAILPARPPDEGAGGNDTLIWVVGRFEIPDTTGSMTSFERTFNLIEWDGYNWKLKKIMEPDWSSVARAESIYMISENDVWVGEYGGPMHWNGSQWISMAQGYGWESIGSSINAIWGSGPDDVFFVSSYGQINHWNGSGFERMETPTDINLTDIWGNAPDNVWCAGWSYQTGESVAIHYNGSQWESLYTFSPGQTIKQDSISNQVYSLLSFDDGSISVLGLQGIYTTTLSTIPAAMYIPHYWWRFPYQMRGNNKNNLFISGQSSLIAHYNGSTVREYAIPGDYNFRGLCVGDNMIVAAGTKNNISVVVRLKSTERSLP